MSDDTLNDLKQFISATVSQQTAELRGDFEQRFYGLEQRFDKLEVKVDGIDEKLDGFIEFVTDALDNNSDVADEQFKDHEKRITKLEQVAHA